MDRSGELRVPLPIKIAFGVITVLFFIILLAFMFVINDVRDISNKNTTLLVRQEVLTRENQARITEIQASRIGSCKETYAGIRKVFLPFFPEKPRSKKQQADIDKFNVTIDTLRAGCGTQTLPDNKN